MENGEVVKVPVYYANPERWKTIQRQGYLRDSKKQLIIPLVVFKRNSLAKDDSITVDKMNPEDPKLHYTFERKYTQQAEGDLLVYRGQDLDFDDVLSTGTVVD